MPQVEFELTTLICVSFTNLFVCDVQSVMSLKTPDQSQKVSQLEKQVATLQQELTQARSPDS